MPRKDFDCETLRNYVKTYCVEKQMTQREFGENLELSKYSFRRFMSSGKETTGVGSDVFRPLNDFFMKRFNYAATYEEEEEELPVEPVNNKRGRSSGSASNSSSHDNTYDDGEDRAFKTPAKKRERNRLYKQTEAYKERLRELREQKRLDSLQDDYSDSDDDV